MKARELMARCSDVVTPDEPITAAAEQMHYSLDAFVPVVRDTASLVLVGVITARDIVVRCVARYHPLTCAVRDHMTPVPLLTLSPDDDVTDAARIMCDREIRRIPVVNAAGALVGVIHEPDLRRALDRIGARPTGAREDSSQRLKRSKSTSRSPVAVASAHASPTAVSDDA